MKFLFIDDNGEWLRSIGRALARNGNVLTEECHSVEDAVAAIEKHQPEVLFLDHHLTDFGTEGFEIAPIALSKGIKVYSTTTNTDAAKEYAKMGIENVNKMASLVAFRNIITQSSAA